MAAAEASRLSCCSLPFYCCFPVAFSLYDYFMRVPAAVEDDLSLMILYLPGHIFSPVPLHRDYLLRLCARDGIASSIIIIRRFASSLFAGCGWLWWVVAPTHALHRPSSTPSFGRFWGFWDEFGAPPFFLRSATTDASLPSSPVTFLLLFAGALFVGSS